MLNRIKTILLERCQLVPELPILAGISGGPDSLCLLDVLHRLGYQLVIAHLDHQLRPESADEAMRVRQMAEEMGLSFVFKQQDVKSFSKDQGLSLEEGARLARYVFLFNEAEKAKAQAVAVGHTADDQVETVLMHLLRGAGMSGLAGMSFRSLPNAWSEKIPLVRPLLSIWRESIWEYLNEHSLLPNLDASNQDTRIYRNRLRHELIPYLEKYNPRFRQSLWRTADILRQDHEILLERVAAAWNAALRESGQGYLAFDYPILVEQPLGIQRYVFRQAILHLRPDIRDFDFLAIDHAVAFLKDPSPHAQSDLIAGIKLMREADCIWLAGWQVDLPGSRWPQVQTDQILQVQVPGQINLPENWRLSGEIIDCSPLTRSAALENADPFQAWLDLDRLETPLRVRSRKSGDRFQPLGMPGCSIKISEFMINTKLPSRARRGWPLILSGDTIAWLPGYRIAHPFCITDQTTRMVIVKLEKKPST